MIIIFGCNSIYELIERTKFAVSLYKLNNEKIIITGTYNETILMKEYITKNIPDINSYVNNFVFIDDKSKDTIDNIINSFSVLKNNNIVLSEHNYHIVSSNYHITRIQYIISVLKLPYSFFFHSVNIPIDANIISKICNEAKILSNSDTYNKVIYNRNTIFIHFLRHAESEYNDRLFVNKKDPAITDLGKQQSSKITGYYDIIITSNLLRSKQTLQYSKLKYTTTIETDLCREFKNGTLSNYIDNEVCEKETLEEFINRINNFKNYLQYVSFTYNKILVISHGIFIKNALNFKGNIKNCELLKLFFNKI